MIRPSAPEEWEYQIPSYFFDASLCEVFRTSSVKNKGITKKGLLEFKTALDWDRTPPRAQIAMIDDSMDRERRLRDHETAFRQFTAAKKRRRQACSKEALESLSRFWNRIKVSWSLQCCEMCDVLIIHATLQPTIEKYERVKTRALASVGHTGHARETSTFDFNDPVSERAQSSLGNADLPSFAESSTSSM